MSALDVLLAPENLLVNVVCGLSVQFAYLALLARVLPPRSTRTFWTVEILYQGATMFLKALYPAPLRIAVGVFGSLVIPLFMLRGSLLRRLVVCSLCLSAQTGAELVAAATWMWVTGLQVMDNGLALRYAPQFIACVSAEIVALALMLSGLRWLCRRFFPLDDSRSERVGRRGAAWLQRFALFPLIQVALIYSMVWIAFDVMRGDGTYMMATAALFVLCMAADVLLFLQMDQSFKQRRAELEASVLEAQVGEYLEELAAMQRLLDDTARLRHDVRNHQAVVSALCANGEYREAEQYLEGARELLKGEGR